MVAHYYTDPEIQQLAEKPVAVFLILWKWRASVQSIRFYVISRWGEIYGRNRQNSHPEKTILMPTLQAECSLDLGSLLKNLTHFAMPIPIVLSSSRQHFCCGKSARRLGGNFKHCVELIDHLDSLGEKIIWAPDNIWGVTCKNRRAQTFYAGRVLHCA